MRCLCRSPSPDRSDLIVSFNRFSPFERPSPEPVEEEEEKGGGEAAGSEVKHVYSPTSCLYCQNKGKATE